MLSNEAYMPIAAPDLSASKFDSAAPPNLIELLGGALLTAVNVANAPLLLQIKALEEKLDVFAEALDDMEQRVDKAIEAAIENLEVEVSATITSRS